MKINESILREYVNKIVNSIMEDLQTSSRKNEIKDKIKNAQNETKPGLEWFYRKLGNAEQKDSSTYGKGGRVVKK
jgi:hypothetical protein